MNKKPLAVRNRPAHAALFSDHLTEKQFSKLSQYIQGNFGIKMPPGKKVMLEGRLRKRVRALGMHSFTEYCRYVFSSDGMDSEAIHMVDAVTTNKTDFFREPSHFTLLADTVLPELQLKYKQRPFTVWSAGCSTGEEPYTLAMVLSEYALKHSAFSFSILATDLSTKVLERAAQGIYPEEKIADVGMHLRRKYLLRSRDSSQGLVRVKDALRTRVRFERINLMDHELNLRKKMHIIFCRNVLIYFERHNQESVVNLFCRHLVSGGFLFIGHSETLNGMDVPLEQIVPTVYKKTRQAP